jgi:hypothetical protein
MVIVGVGDEDKVQLFDFFGLDGQVHYAAGDDDAMGKIGIG